MSHQKWRILTFIVFTSACSGKVATACWPSAFTESKPPLGPTRPYSTFGRETRAKNRGKSAVIIRWTFSATSSEAISSGNKWLNSSSLRTLCSCHFRPSLLLIFRVDSEFDSNYDSLVMTHQKWINCPEGENLTCSIFVRSIVWYIDRNWAKFELESTFSRKYQSFK